MATGTFERRSVAERLGVPLLVGGAGLALAACVLWYPMLALALCGAAAATWYLTVARPGSLVRVFGVSCGATLFGYAFLGRGFAYLGHAPLFIGELVLALGLLAALSSGTLTRLAHLPGTWILAALAAWGTARTVPYLGAYGVDALRDAVIFGYAAFAFVVVAVVASRSAFFSVIRVYARIVPLFILWVPMAALLVLRFEDSLPLMPGTRDATLPTVKFGDLACHLSGAAVFMGLRLDKGTATLHPVRQWLLWGLVAVGIGLVASKSRGGLLSIVAAFGVLFVARPFGPQWRLAPWVATAALGVLLAGSFSDGGRSERTFSATQIRLNVESLLGVRHRAGSLSGTAEWRLQWWRKIVGYTAGGPLFWGGRGFGINLADADGFQVDVENQTLRSPHNGHLTLLARAGVPGFALWMVFLLWLAASLVAAHLRAKQRGDPWWAAVHLWLLAYWASFLVNATFDVFLEGPQGGIWFWSLSGLAMSALLLDPRTRDADSHAVEYWT